MAGDAKTEITKHTIHFEARTRRFMVHEPLKTGEWQDARETIGPQRGGVVGNMELRTGKYLGAAAVPQAFDKRYFTLQVMAPYSEAIDARAETSAQMGVAHRRICGLCGRASAIVVPPGEPVWSVREPPRHARRVGDVRRYRFNDIDLCIAGRCIGKRCPCLCHVEALHLAHYNGHLVRRRGRIRGVSPWQRPRKRRP